MSRESLRGSSQVGAVLTCGFVVHAGAVWGHVIDCRVLGAAIDHWGEIPDRAIAELRSAIDLMCEGKTCAAISALLAARSELTALPTPLPLRVGQRLPLLYSTHFRFTQFALLSGLDQSIRLRFPGLRVVRRRCELPAMTSCPFDRPHGTIWGVLHGDPGRQQLIT